MEYTKDIVLEVNYGQVHSRKSIIEKVLNTISRHKIITVVVSVTLMLMVVDFMLICSFVQILLLI